MPQTAMFVYGKDPRATVKCNDKVNTSISQRFSAHTQAVPITKRRVHSLLIKLQFQQINTAFVEV